MANVSRRNLLALGASVLVASGCGAARAGLRPRSPDIGLQLTTVLKPLYADLGGTLKAARRIGYRNVETIGSLGKSAAQLRADLDHAGLHSVSQTVCPDSFYPVMQAWAHGKMELPEVFKIIKTDFSLAQMPFVIDDAIAKAHTLGQTTIIWQTLPDEDTGTAAGVDRICAALNKAGEQCRSAGLRLALHNGSTGFKPVDGRTPYDSILQNTDPSLVFLELDVYWARKVGIDPIAYLERNPDRYVLCHLKDISPSGEIVGIGEGTIDFKALFAALERSSVEHCYVEYDLPPNAVEASARAFATLRGLRR